MPRETCRPGGCSAIGCEGGHYCFNADGTPKPEITPEKEAQLQAALSPYSKPKVAPGCCELCGKPWSEHDFGVPAPECP